MSVFTIYCYFIGKLREIYFIEGSRDPFGLIKHLDRTEKVLVAVEYFIVLWNSLIN